VRAVERKWTAGLLIVMLLATAADRRAQSQDRQTGAILPPSLRAAELVEFAASAGQANTLGHAFPQARKVVLGSSGPDSPGLTAFEENSFFIYAAAAVPGAGSVLPVAKGPAQQPRLLRRVVLLKPSVFVVDEDVSTSHSPNLSSWGISSQQMPEIRGQQTRIREGDSLLVCETLFPKNATLVAQACQGEGCQKEQDRFLVKVGPRDNPDRTRFLHILSVGKTGSAAPDVHSALEAKGDQLVLTISFESRIYHLDLPPPGRGAGRIEITQSKGKPLLDYRPFPSGIMPHEAEGIRLLDQWDADYRGKNPPMWDIGKASRELKEIVGAGTIRKCRAIDLCCGAGTDAIYMAKQGFDVTAIDIAPTALSQAEERARKAGASVQWVLADVLAAPILEPFDFIYDRGCYHVVREQNLAAYLETLRRLSHPGSQFLLLAARRDFDAGGSGVAGVSEEELRYDFLSLFDIEWLRETRLEANRPGGIGPPSWTALLRRKPDPAPEAR